MVEMAFSNFQDTIYKINLDTLVVTRLFRQQASSIAAAPNGDYIVADGRDDRSVWKISNPDPDAWPARVYIYEQENFIRSVKLRPIDSAGNYRIYFSEAWGTGENGSIYYLDASNLNKPVLYYKVELDKIPAYNPCNHKYEIGYWGGDFAFDDKNTLYLSNGNFDGASIYKVSGATLDNVSGDPVRIYTEPDGNTILGMQFVSPSTLYFCSQIHGSTDSKIMRLRLSSLHPTGEEVYVYHEPPDGGHVSDLSLMSPSWPYGASSGKQGAFQYYPGLTLAGINRRKHMSGNLEKLRDIPEADVVAIMGHRAPGADYSSTHPPLKEMGEPDCPIRQIVAPTAGAAAGDRVRYSQWTDSMYFAPSTPYWRSYWGSINCRGCDPGTLSGRQILEARERDIEAYTKIQMDTEMFDPARSGMRGCTVHGHSLRLEENGMQFDMLARTEMGVDGNVYAVKDQVGIPLDKKINLGKPMSESEAKKRTTIFRVDGIPMCGNAGARKYDEAVEALHHMWELRSRWGFRPE